MQNKFKMLLGTAALGLTLCVGATAARAMDMPQTMEFKSALNNNLDKLFMVHAYQGNLAEIKLGKLASQRASDPMVKKVAQTIVFEHSIANRDLKGHFKDLGVPIPPNAGIANEAVYEKMTKLRGSAFDKAYIAAQLGGHEAAVVLYSHEINKGKNEKAKAYASNKLPGIIGHTAMLYDAAAQVKAPGYGLRPAAVREEAPAASNEHEKMAEMMMEKMGKM